MKRCTVLSHVAFEDLGLLEPVLRERGFQLRIVDVPAQGVPGEADVASADLWVVLGGPIGVYETDRYPFLGPEQDAIGRRLTAQAPVLGICLGAQMMAAALGGTVAANPNGKEIGWSLLSLSDAGRRSPVRHLEGLNVLHWHGDAIDPPKGAAILASTAATACQAFAWGKRALALQFHPEPTARGLERWLVGHAAELNMSKVDIAALRSDNHRFAPLLTKALADLAAEWLNEAGV